MLFSGPSFKKLLADHTPIQIAGVFSAYTALAATQVGHRALYLSGSTAAFGASGRTSVALPELMEVVEIARQITDASYLPLLVDINNGWNGTHLIQAIRELEQVGVAAVQIDDHEPFNALGGSVSKPIVSKKAMIDIIAKAVDTRSRSQLYIVAHTDAFAQEGLHAAIDRAADYAKAGADAIYIASVASLADYQHMTDAIGVPVIAMVDALGKHPLFRPTELEQAGVSMIVHPMSGYENANGEMQHAYQVLLDCCSDHATQMGMTAFGAMPGRREVQTHS